MNTKVLVGCEESGTFRDALKKKGIYAKSVDLQPSSSPGLHYTGDIFHVIDQGWTHLIAFPPCTYLCKAQLWQCVPGTKRAADRDKAVEFVLSLVSSGIPHISIENPSGYLSKAFRPPSQIVRPWWFGDPYDKEICLWLTNLPPLIATCYNPIRKSVSNHTNSRMTQKQRSRIRSSWKYYPGMVEAMINQWFP